MIIIVRNAQQTRSAGENVKHTAITVLRRVNRPKVKVKITREQAMKNKGGGKPTVPLFL